MKNTESAHAKPAHTTSGYWLWQFVAGLTLGATAILSLPVIYGDLGGDRGAVNWFTIFLATFVSGFVFWWLLITRRAEVTPRRGVLAAVLAALTAFPLVYFVMFVLLREVPLLLSDGGAGEHLAYVLIISLLSLVFGGWFTVIVAALVGGLLAFVQGRLLAATQRYAVPVVTAQTGRAKDAFRQRPLAAVGTALVTLLALLILAAGAWIWFAPLNLSGLVHGPAPVADYAEAVAVIAQMQAAEEAETVNPVCRSKLLSHAAKTERVIVFVHGFTNCPEQFAPLGQQFYDAGYNVFIPRMPYHGLSDRLTTDLSKLSSEALVEFGGDIVDIAQGLGDDVTVVGLSGGGTVTAWIAQTRADVDTAVLIAPMLGILKLPEYTVKPVANATITLPNFFIWWDAKTKERLPGPDYAYPRYATKAVGALMRVSALTELLVASEAPQAQRIIAVTNEIDPAVNNAVLHNVVEQWQRHDAAVTTYEFPADRRLPHDLIDPNQTAQRIDIVYPLLMDLITAAR